MVHIPRADLPLRTEVTYLWQLLALDPAALVCLDELDLPALHSQHRLRLTLVDHNRLAAPLAALTDCIDRILDHHVVRLFEAFV